MPSLLLYKPYGVLSQFTDEGTGHPTLSAYLPIKNVYPAGRLDRDSEGLLLLTDDGALAHLVTHPQRQHEKTYWVLVEGEADEEKLNQLRRGVRIKGDYLTQPAGIRRMETPELPAREKPVTPHGATAWLEIRLREGKKRQIRHMTAAVGLFTLRLVRAAIGPLTLQGLKPGEWRFLNPREIHLLRSGENAGAPTRPAPGRG